MRLSIREIAVFSMLGALMYAAKVLMEAIPNVHLTAVFISAFTIVYRKKALYPLYVFVFLTGLLNGFSMWWIPYLYIWTILWAAVMLFTRKKAMAESPIKYMLICAGHGLLFGTLYAPAQAIMFGLSFRQMIAWIIAGLPWDCIHGISNFFCGGLIIPLSKALFLLEKNSHIQ